MRHHLLQLSIFLLSLSPAAADRDPNYFPPLPDDVIPPILDEKIKASELLGYPPEVHSVTLEYPWRPSHDEQASREKHLSWQFQQDHAYCVHVDPAFREPGTSFAQFLGSECSDKLHKWQPKDSEYRQQCFNAGETADQEVDTGYAIYTRRELWANTEHCRAGCETCFDAMEEYGAREAYCAYATLFFFSFPEIPSFLFFSFFFLLPKPALPLCLIFVRPTDTAIGGCTTTVPAKWPF